jgi:hypothetical protein
VPPTYATFCTAQGDPRFTKLLAYSDGTGGFSGCFGIAASVYFAAISAKTRRKNSCVTTIDCVAGSASLPNIASIVGSSPPRKLCIASEQILPALLVSHCRNFIVAAYPRSVALIAPQFKFSQQNPLTFLKHPQNKEVIVDVLNVRKLRGSAVAIASARFIPEILSIGNTIDVRF